MSFILTVAFVVFLLAMVGLKYWLAFRKMRHVSAHADAVPRQFADRVSLDAHRRAAAYTVEKTRLGLFETAIGALLLVGMTLLGGLDWIVDLLASLGTSDFVLQMLDVGVVLLLVSMLDLPFAWYRQFRIEQKYGFNRMTLALWIADLGKSYAVKVANDGRVSACICQEHDPFIIGDLRLIRRVNSWQDDEIGGYELFVKDDHSMTAINDALVNHLPPEWMSRSIPEIYPNIFDWLNIQDVNRNVIFIVMSVVAIINLATCLQILMLERTRMIGILKAIGATDWLIQRVFLYHATDITLAGIGIGFVTGTGICLLQQYTHFIKPDEASYYVRYAPVTINGIQVAVVCMTTALVCYLSLLLPTWLIRKISPVKAIQFRKYFEMMKICFRACYEHPI